MNFGVIFSPAGKFGTGIIRPEPAPAGQMPCRLSCTASCIFPGRRCFSPQRVVLYFYLYPRGFVGGCAGNPRGVAKMGRTKRPVLTLGEHKGHWGHKTRNAVSRKGPRVRIPNSPPNEARMVTSLLYFFAKTNRVLATEEKLRGQYHAGDP